MTGRGNRIMDGMRAASRDDRTEDLYWSVRELIENFNVVPREVRRLVNMTLRGRTPASIAERVLEEDRNQEPDAA